MTAPIRRRGVLPAGLAPTYAEGSLTLSNWRRPYKAGRPHARFTLTQPQTGRGGPGRVPTPSSKPGGAFDPFGIVAATKDLLGRFTDLGQIALGLALAGVGLLLVTSQTEPGKTVARGTRKVAVRAARAAITHT